MGKSSSSEQSVGLPKHGETVAMQHNIKLTGDDMTTISRSKLEHLKDLADDDRMKELVKGISVDRIVGSISGSIFFVALGGILGYFQLQEYGKILFWTGLVGGGALSIYCFFKEYSANKSLRMHREKLVNEINKILVSIY